MERDFSVTKAQEEEGAAGKRGRGLTGRERERRESESVHRRSRNWLRGHEKRATTTGHSRINQSGVKINCKTLASRVAGSSARPPPSPPPRSPDASLRFGALSGRGSVLCAPRRSPHAPLCPRECVRARARAHACVHACARRSRNVCGFRERGWNREVGRSDGKVNTDIAARKRRLPANANVARGAWRPHGRESPPSRR